MTVIQIVRNFQEIMTNSYAPFLASALPLIGIGLENAVGAEGTQTDLESGICDPMENREYTQAIGKSLQTVPPAIFTGVLVSNLIGTSSSALLTLSVHDISLMAFLMTPPSTTLIKECVSDRTRKNIQNFESMFTSALKIFNLATSCFLIVSDPHSLSVVVPYGTGLVVNSYFLIKQGLSSKKNQHVI